VNALRSPDRAIIVVTHYQRLLDYIVPDFVHVLSAAALSAPAARNWPSSSKPRATAGSKLESPGPPAPRLADAAGAKA
jgi:Fe-S cluster assembly ATP-binding protein